MSKSSDEGRKGKAPQRSTPLDTRSGKQQPPQPNSAKSQSDENVLRLHAELEKELGKKFLSKKQGVWKKIGKRLLDKKWITSAEVQDLNSMAALFRILLGNGKIKPGKYGYLRVILVQYEDDDTEAGKIIDEYTAKIRKEKQAQLKATTDNTRQRAGTDEDRGPSTKRKKTGDSDKQ